MDVRIQAIHFDASEKLVAFINKKAERLQRHYANITTVDVKLSVVKRKPAASTPCLRPSTRCSRNPKTRSNGSPLISPSLSSM